MILSLFIHMKNFFIGVPMFTKFIKERMDNKKNVVFIITRENLRKIPKGGAALRKVFGKGNINKVHPMSFVDKLRLDRKSGHAGIVYEKSQVLWAETRETVAGESLEAFTFTTVWIMEDPTNPAAAVSCASLFIVTNTIRKITS